MRRSAISGYGWECKFTAIDDIEASLTQLERSRPANSVTVAAAPVAAPLTAPTEHATPAQSGDAAVWRQLLSSCVGGDDARVSYDVLMCVGKGIYNSQYDSATNDEFTRMLFGTKTLKDISSCTVSVPQFLSSAVAAHMFDRFCLPFDGESLIAKKQEVARQLKCSGLRAVDEVVERITQFRINLVDRLARFADLFEKVDENGDGGIDFNEMMLFGIALHSSDPADEWTWEKQRKCWQKMDLDGNETIDRDEFAFFYRSVLYDYDDRRFNDTMADYEGAAKGITSPARGPVEIVKQHRQL